MDALSTYSRESANNRDPQELPRVPDSLVSVIIVSCQREDLLIPCLESVVSQTYRNLECRIFLNHGDAGAVQKWKNVYPDFIFAYDPDNSYYCKPCNKGIRDSRGDFVLCLNDDIVLSPQFIEKALAVMFTDDKIGSVNGCLLRDDGKTIDSTGFFWAKSRKPYERAYGRVFKSACVQGGYIFGANGAAAFYRRVMLEDIKIDNEYFDEDFGIYYEDFDLSWRAQRFGWKAYYCSEAIAYHKRGATVRLSTSSHPRFLKRFALANIPEELKLKSIRNRYATMIKNDKLIPFLLDLPWILFYEMRFLAYLLLFRRGLLWKVLKDRSYITAALDKRRKILNLKKSR